MPMYVSDFFKYQLTFPRVAEAYASKKQAIEALLQINNIKTQYFDLFLRAFKQEQKLEAWVKTKKDNSYLLLQTYDFCESSGAPGPKRKSGDLQIPEGCYEVTNFNPQSAYHLSFKINYPNQSDLFFADKENPGGVIYIHGGCSSTGCLSIGDNNIEELYLLAAMAKSAGVIKVHIFPCYLSDNNYQQLIKHYQANQHVLTFWANLKPVYDSFENKKELADVEISNTGRYLLKTL